MLATLPPPQRLLTHEEHAGLLHALDPLHNSAEGVVVYLLQARKEMQARGKPARAATADSPVFRQAVADLLLHRSYSVKRAVCDFLNVIIVPGTAAAQFAEQPHVVDRLLGVVHAAAAHCSSVSPSDRQDDVLLAGVSALWCLAYLVHHAKKLVQVPLSAASVFHAACAVTAAIADNDMYRQGFQEYARKTLAFYVAGVAARWVDGSLGARMLPALLTMAVPTSSLQLQALAVNALAAALSVPATRTDDVMQHALSAAAVCVAAGECPAMMNALLALLRVLGPEVVAAHVGVLLPALPVLVKLLASPTPAVVASALGVLEYLALLQPAAVCIIGHGGAAALLPLLAGTSHARGAASTASRLLRKAREGAGAFVGYADACERLLTACDTAPELHVVVLSLLLALALARLVATPPSPALVQSMLHLSLMSSEPDTQLLAVRLLQRLVPALVERRQLAAAAAEVVIAQSFTMPAPARACAICMSEDVHDWTALPCCHVFHRDCIRSWLVVAKHATCPMCMYSFAV
jgi:hypothetical protein